MRSLKYIFIPALLAVFFLFSCTDEENKSRFDNKVFINSSTKTTTMLIVLGSSEYTQTLGVSSAKPIEQETEFTFTVSSSLLNTFRQAYYYPDAVMLPSENYEIENSKVLMQQGAVRSTEFVVNFNGIDELDRGAIYVLPVTVSANTNVDFIESNRTHYFVFRKGALINVAADIDQNYISVNWANSADVRAMSEVTVEALLYLDNLESGLTDSNIRTFMGVEGGFLIRLGDTFEIGEVMVVKGSGKYPTGSGDRTTFPVKQWSHLAITHSSDNTIRIYLDGQLQSISQAVSGNINFSSNFYIGRSYNTSRWWPGMISEARVWNVVRTQEEIEQGMYGVSPDSDGLLAYWKFNEGEGNTIMDQTGNGNTAVAGSNLKWVSVSLPEDDE